MTDKPDTKETMWTLAKIMDGVLPLLQRAAYNEAKAEAGKPMRNMTQQSRLEAATSAVARAFEIMGADRP